MDAIVVPETTFTNARDHELNGVLGDAQILRKNGEPLPSGAITDLRSEIGCIIVVKGQGSTEEYNHAIDRWNQAGIKEAVCRRCVSKWRS
jgi:hypothetical protein